MAELRLGADARAPNPGYVQHLVEFGYPQELACRALNAVRNESLEAAIDWLDRNRDALDAASFVDPALLAEQEHRPALGKIEASPKDGSDTTQPSASDALLKSDIRPDGLSRSKLEAERKKHADYKRQKQMQEERELLKKKEQDAKLVRENYAREKAKKAALKNAPAAAATAAAPAAAAAAAPPAKTAGTGDVVVQVRLPNRPAVVIKGLTGASSLLDLYARVDAEVKDSNEYVLTQPFPPPVTHFYRNDARTLGELGLCPRAALTVTDVASLGKVSQGVGGRAAVAAPAEPAPPVALLGGGGGVPLGGGAPAAAGGPEQLVVHKYRGPPMDCSVCQTGLEAEQDAVTVRCGHVFHDECWREWRNGGNVACPSCAAP